MSRPDLTDSERPVLQQPYNSILLRYWREGETMAWRYVIQDLGSGEQYRFANIDLLIAFLYQHMEGEAQQPERDEP